MKVNHLVVAAALLTGACATSAPALQTGAEIDPRQAIIAAADAAPAGVTGVFAITVRATGRERGRLYLNSELDYRDQRNLTINVAPGAAAQLERRHGMPPERYFLGKSIRVRGTARRIRIDFVSEGRRTGLYYYQTQVAVSDPDQIEIVEQPR